MKRSLVSGIWAAWVAAAVLLVVPRLQAGSTAAMQAPAPASKSADPSSVWDSVYSQAQANRGKEAYAANCAVCHLETLQGAGPAAALVGPAFTEKWRDQNLAQLFDRIQTTMPQTGPGTLTSKMYIDIVAYILEANSYPAGKAELAPDTLALKKIVFKSK